MRRRGQQQWIVAPIVSAVLMATGCVSLSSRYATRQERPGANIAQDESECEAYATRQAKHRGDHYKVCMVARWYAANVDMDELAWTIGVAQTRAHEPDEVMRDMVACDRRADATKKSDVVPPLAPEQESIIASQAHAAGGWSGEPYQQRPNATRMLLYCLQEQGYKVVPWVRH
jgi:hypothetical protein